MFILVMYVIYNNGEKDKPAIYSKNSVDEAVSLFHSQLSSIMNNEATSHGICMVVDVYSGRVVRSETWTKPVQTTTETEG